MSKTGIYPPTGEEGLLVDRIADLPNHSHWLKDQNEFYRLYVDTYGNKYIYRSKNVTSPLNERTEQEQKFGITSSGTVNKNVRKTDQ